MPRTQERPADASAARIAAGRKFAVEAARTLANTRCHNVAVLDVSGLSPITDFFVLATGTSARQMQTAAEDLQELGANSGFTALSHSDDPAGNWIAIDFFDVVAHVFSQDARSFYDLDNLWGDARRVEWEAQGAANTAVPVADVPPPPDGGAGPS